MVHDEMPEHRSVHLHEVADITVGFPFKSAQFSDDPSASALIRGDNIGQGTLKDRSFKRWHRVSTTGSLTTSSYLATLWSPWIVPGSPLD